MSEPLKVVELFHHTLQDIPACMEAVAQKIREGEHGDVTCAVAVILQSDGSPVVFGWGRTDAVHSIGVLGIGMGWLQNHLA